MDDLQSSVAQDWTHAVYADPVLAVFGCEAFCDVVVR